MMKAAIPVILAAIVSLPATAEAQQDPTKVGEGAQVYATTCARCHNARSGTERTDAEWGPIVAHMRARANMTKGQAEAVLAFLQATNLPEPGSSVGGASSAPDGDMAVVLPAELRLALSAPWLVEALARLAETRPSGVS